jgi:hypothetical protein
MRSRFLAVLGLLLLAGATALPGSARAFTFIDLGQQAGSPAGPLVAVEVLASDVGGSFDVLWSVGDPLLGATATFQVASFSAAQVLLDVTLAHTTDLADSGLANAAVLSMGFGVTPNVVATLAATGTVFDMVSHGSGPQQTFPGGFKQIDVCVFAAGCSGGSISAGLAAGQADAFRISLAPVAGDLSAGLTLAFFPIKFQTSAGSFEPPGSLPPSMPEPTSVLLYAAGILVVASGAGLYRRS